MKHLFIPDTQIRPGVSLIHLNALGNYIVEKQFDKIIMAGDWADMHSLSTYDTGKKAGEGARYSEDIEAANYALRVLHTPIMEYNLQQSVNKKKQYKPEIHITLGNHENRINRHINTYPVLADTLSTDNILFSRYGWIVHPFLEVVEIDEILYSHYFPRNAQGRIVQTIRGAPSAALQVRREMQSCTSGHLQGVDWHVQQTGSKRLYGLIAGSFYLHEESYLSPQGTSYWRGVIVKNQVNEGEYDPMFISMDYLLKNYWDGNGYYYP